MNRNVWLLFMCQALVNASGIGQVSVSALIGHSLAADKALATLPYALQMAATMAASIPAGFLFARFGRKAGFFFGAACMLIGTITFGIGVYRADFLIYCLGALPSGIGFGIGQHYRFAAAEVAAPQARARALSLVMAGGVLAALFGPELVIYTKDLTPPVLFLGTYAALALLPLSGLILLALARLPPAPPRHASPVPFGQIIGRADFIIAVVAGLVGYGSMNLVMTSTPVQMMLCGFGVTASTHVIGLHALAMYGPGFFTGRLIQRFGAHRVVCAGGVLIVACAAMSLVGSAYVDFIVALMLLGVGWNFMFVGATALLTTAHGGVERVRAQAANDFIVFGTVTVTSFSSGALHEHAGWVALNATVVPAVAVAVALVLWHRATRARLVAASPASRGRAAARLSSASCCGWGSSWRPARPR
ncbi:MAG: MFS transporter [Rhodospirillales bacterium]|nr:MFS transporter [Rhodospirillales bacterium]